MFVNANNNAVDLTDLFRGRSAFLICGGPSFNRMPARVHRILKRPGFLTMAVNNAPRVFRPNLWCCVDEPDHFIRSIFIDPTITKFLPIGKREKRIFDSDAWQHLETKTRDCPNVYYFKLTHEGYPENFLEQDACFWGFDGKHGGGRSVMHVAPKILYRLGIRSIFLLGADFHMSETHMYAFDQHRAAGSIRGNNSTYAKLNQRFTTLRPQLEAAGLHVYNCTPGSQLDAFDRIDFMVAADQVQNEFNVDTHNERTFGLYERAGKAKLIDKWRARTDEAMKAAAPHITKALRNPHVDRFDRRAKRHIQKFFKAHKRLIQHENEAEALRLGLPPNL